MSVELVQIDAFTDMPVFGQSSGGLFAERDAGPWVDAARGSRDEPVRDGVCLFPSRLSLRSSLVYTDR